METSAVRFSPPPPSRFERAAAPSNVLSGSVRATRLRDLLTLLKPRVMSLTVFTALVGMLIAPSHIDAIHGSIAILAIATGAGAAGALNMWYDADIDAVMRRTATRPIPRGVISPSEALAFGLALALGAVAVLALATNMSAAALLAFTIFFYAFVYTVWLKRRTPMNIVIGGAAGALPPVIGWAAATGGVGLEPILLFLIVFLWTPPHFWALSLNRSSDYACAGVPMLPVVAGPAATSRRIFIYSALLAMVSILPSALGFAGLLYGAVAGAAGAIFVALAARLRVSHGADRRAAHRLFAFSILYLFILFSALLLDHFDARWGHVNPPSGGRVATEPARVHSAPRFVGQPIGLKTNEAQNAVR